MKLTLRRNHFFRSFWSVKRAKEMADGYINELTTADIKYIDLDVVDGPSLVGWLDKCRISFASVDVSYWNTHSVGIGYDVD
jgi:hypothetical protein